MSRDKLILRFSDSLNFFFSHAAPPSKKSTGHQHTKIGVKSFQYIYYRVSQVTKFISEAISAVTQT